MEVGKAPTGLGKGLAGILGDALRQDRAPEVSQLLGRKAVRRDPEVRTLVSELGLRFIADTYASDGAFIVRRESDESLAAITSQLPSSWNGLDAMGFELAGRLWKTMESGADGASQIVVGGRAVLLTKQTDSEGHPTAAAVVRFRQFDVHEEATIVQLLHSISAAASGDGFSVNVSEFIAVTSESTLDQVDSKMQLRAPGLTDSASASSSTATTSAAKAACALCSVDLSVQFAGETVSNDSLVSIVVLRTASRHGSGVPLFGLAVGAETASLGAAEAVFRAARVIGADPFQGLGLG